MIFIFFCLTSLRMIILGPFILLQMVLYCSLLWSEYIPVCVCLHTTSFICLSVSRHLGFFHVLDIVNTAAMNIRVHLSFQITVFSGSMPRNGLSWHKWHLVQRPSCRGGAWLL